MYIVIIIDLLDNAIVWYEKLIFYEILGLKSWRVITSSPFKGLATVAVGLPVFSFHLIGLNRGEA